MNENIIGKRIAAIAIDSIIWLVIFIIFSITLGQTDTSGGVNFSLSGLPFLLYTLLGLIYFICMEVALGATLGKLALGITVVDEAGKRLTLRQSVIRNVMRFVDGFPYFVPYLIGLVAVASSPTKQRLGDRVAGTFVVKPE